jgi:hypothetical protein
LTQGSLASQSDSTERPTELLYARIVEEVKDGGLSSLDVAQVIGVAERQVRNWSAGANTPSGRNRDRLLELHYLVRLLREVYTREGAEIWLHGRKRSLKGKRPIDLLETGKSDVVLDAIERLRAGAM